MKKAEYVSSHLFDLIWVNLVKGVITRRYQKSILVLRKKIIDWLVDYDCAKKNKKFSYEYSFVMISECFGDSGNAIFIF